MTEQEMREFYEKYGYYEGAANNDLPEDIKEFYEEYGLVEEVTIEISELFDCYINDEDEILEAVVDFLTEEFGFCIKNLDMEIEEGLVKCYNIEWDIDD